MFNFCIKDLLTHLSRRSEEHFIWLHERAKSITPTRRYVRGAQKHAGGTCGPERWYHTEPPYHLLSLAAHESGVDIHDMDHAQDYVLCWEKSARETYRMLEHFKPDFTAPHKVSQTWNPYQTRELVRILTIPMADITQTINNNIALQGDQQRDVEDALSKGESLASALHLDKIEYEMPSLGRPRTACSDAACVDYHDDKRHYRSYWHDPCYLQNVQVDKIQCEQLMQCYAFGCGSSQDCEKCQHSWQVHLHVLWEPIEVTNKVIDEAVQQRLSDNASGVDVMKEAIRSREKLIEKHKHQRERIQKAADQWAVFLRNSAITAYNASKLEYLDRLIDEEKAKVQAGGPEKGLKDLPADRKQHEEEVKTLNEYVKACAKDKLLDQEASRTSSGPSSRSS